MKAGTSRRIPEAIMNTEIALSAAALAYGRPVDGFDAGDRKVIGSVVRALRRLLEDDGVRPALEEEEQRAQIVVRDGTILLLASVSSQIMLADDEERLQQDNARPYRLPPLQTRQPRSFAFG